MLNDLELLERQIATLFVQDKRKLLHVNEPEQPEAPRFFLGRTKEGFIYRFRNDVPDKVAKQLEEVVTNRADLKNLEKETVQLSELFESILRQHKPIQSVWSGPAYRFPNEVDAPSGVVKITETNINLLDANFAEWKADLESRQPCVAVVQKNRAVSICCSSRTSTHAAEAGLETHPAFRRRGYAARVVIGWAAEVREQGRIPLYSTAWDNGASRAVAKKLGLVMYATDLHFT